VILMMSFTIV